MRKLTLIGMISVLTIGIADVVRLRHLIEKHERAYKYGCADRWLDQNGRNNKHFRWTSLP